MRRQAEEMNEARAFLEHVLSHHPDSSPDGCGHYETYISGGEPAAHD